MYGRETRFNVPLDYDQVGPWLRPEKNLYAAIYETLIVLNQANSSSHTVQQQTP